MPRYCRLLLLFVALGLTASVLAGGFDVAVASKDIAQPAERCASGEPEFGSEICAQWAAVKSAREATRIAWIAMYGNLAALAGLLATLLATAWAARAANKAAIAAERAIEIAERTAKQQLRAYVSLLGFKMLLHRDANENIVEGEIVAHWRNAGQTPAFKVDNMVNWGSFEGEIPDDFGFPPFDDRDVFGTPTLGPDIRLGSGSPPVSPSEMTAVSGKAKRLYVWATADYVDAFGAGRRTEASAEVEIKAPFSGEDDFSFKVLRRFNGMDDSCMYPPEQGKPPALA